MPANPRLAEAIAAITIIRIEFLPHVRIVPMYDTAHYTRVDAIVNV
jgi:hypothetical protein